MSDIAGETADAYAARHQLRLASQLGTGVHGIVLVAHEKVKSDRSALKAHKSFEPYLLERNAYERLRYAHSFTCWGFASRRSGRSVVKPGDCAPHLSTRFFPGSSAGLSPLCDGVKPQANESRVPTPRVVLAACRSSVARGGRALRYPSR